MAAFPQGVLRKLRLGAAQAQSRDFGLSGTVRVGQRSPSCRNAVPCRLRRAAPNIATPTTIKNQAGTSIIA